MEVKIITRKEAQEQGLKHYFGRKPCPRGHVSERRVSNRACIQCTIEKTVEWKKKPNSLRHIRNTRFVRLFGIDHDAYDLLLANQNYVCAICKQPEKLNQALSVDHCHNTGRVRGLLCFDCNIGLGKFRDDPALIATALEYLT